MNKEYIPISASKTRADTFVMINAWERDDGKCHYCGTKINPWLNVAFDHKVPKSKGGLFTDDNIVLSCVSCNSKKGAKAYNDFIIIMGSK